MKEIRKEDLRMSAIKIGSHIFSLTEEFGLSVRFNNSSKDEVIFSFREMVERAFLNKEMTIEDIQNIIYQIIDNSNKDSPYKAKRINYFKNNKGPDIKSIFFSENNETVLEIIISKEIENDIIEDKYKNRHLIEIGKIEVKIIVYNKKGDSILYDVKFFRGLEMCSKESINKLIDFLKSNFDYRNMVKIYQSKWMQK